MQAAPTRRDAQVVALGEEQRLLQRASGSQVEADQRYGAQRTEREGGEPAKVPPG